MGPVPYIAQNGNQVSFGSSAAVKRNIVTGHNYLPAGHQSCGPPLYHAAGDTSGGTKNTLTGNEQPLCVVVPPVAPATCIATNFYRDGINLTAAKIGGVVTGKLDAAGCDIGVCSGPGTTGSVNAATITNAKYFGVVNHSAKVDVKDSTISQIGNVPFDGTQHGVGILYTTEALAGGPTAGTASGLILRNTLSQYQKGGITVRGAGAWARIKTDNQHRLWSCRLHRPDGIQVWFDGSAAVKRNTVTGHNYTPEDTEACGLLFYLAAGTRLVPGKPLTGNELDLCVGPR